MTLIDREQASIIFKATFDYIHSMIKSSDLLSHYGTSEQFKTTADMFICLLNEIPAVSVDETTGEINDKLSQEQTRFIVNVFTAATEKLNE